MAQEQGWDYPGPSQQQVLLSDVTYILLLLASCIFSVTMQFIPLQVHKPSFNVFLVWSAWQYLHISPVFLCSRWILPCHSQHHYMEVVLAAPLSGLTPLLLPLCLQLLVPAILAGRISLDVPPSVWHREVFLGARKRHFVKCSLLLFWAEMKVSGLWPCLLAGNCQLPPRRLEALWHKSILLSHPLDLTLSVCFLVTAILG